MTALLVGLCLAAGAASASSPVARRPRLSGGLKMVAATAYVALALHQGAAGSGYGRLVLGALGVSWLGDLLLLGSSRRAFLAGLAAFLLAHLSYAGAFLLRGVAVIPAAWAALALAGGAFLVLRWLERHRLEGRVRVPVALYLAAITLMLALAVGTAWPPGIRASPGRWAGAAVLAGAALFAASDVLVARERFVRSAAINRLAGRPLYFAGQLLLAASVS